MSQTQFEAETAIILVVEDNHITRTSIDWALSRDGFTVWEAANGAEALRLASRKPDLVVLDVHLPDADGRDVCRRVKADPETSRVPVLMVSGIANSPEDRARGLEVGADAYLIKPVHPGELLAQVKTLLNGRRAEREAILASEKAANERERVTVLLERIPGIFFALDAGWRFTYASHGLMSLVGKTKEQILGKGVEGVLPQSMCAALGFEFGRPMAAGSSVTFDVQYPPSGNGFDVHAYRSTEGLSVYLNQVTGGKQGEDSLRRCDQLLRLVLDSLPVGVVVLDRTGHVVLSNPAAERIWSGFLDGAVESLACIKAWRHDTGERIGPGDWASARALSRGESSVRDLIDIETVDGLRKTVQNSAVPVRDADGQVTGALLIDEDVTDRQRLEAQVLQAQKMQAIGQLATGVAHDFNNFLTVINGCAELLLAEVPPEDSTREPLTDILQAVEKSAALTRQLLAFSRQHACAPRVLDLNAVVTDAVRMLGRLIGEDIRLSTDLSAGLGAVRADAGQVEQVLLNLAVNARDAMPTGGRLTIETRNVEIDEEYARSNCAARAGPHVLLAVSDTGSGMSPEVKARLFEPFFTTKIPGKGTGLGLATVYGIVTRAGGHIAVCSEVGLGTTFNVYLPRLVAVSEVVNRVSVVRTLPRGTETVLLVEDDDRVRKLAQQVLEKCGYTVLGAAGAEDAVRAAEQHLGPVDLLITDVVMPATNGRELADDVAMMRPGLKVLFLSGHTDDAVVRHGIERESANFLQKPFSPMALAYKVREILDQGL
jgi:two-component system, cell cycle sensor histidine kinase and response regulator CckA